jgi:hypothetical protein
VNFLALTKFLAKEFFLIFFVIAIVALLSMRPLLSGRLILYAFYAIIGFAWIVVFLRWYTRDRIRRVYSEHWGEYEGGRKKVKNFAQGLVWRLQKGMLDKNANPSRYKLTIYIDDYKGVSVLRRPGILRDFYVAVVALP